MSPEFILGIAIAGTLTGAVYGLMALGLSAIFGVMRVVNFAHGEMMVGGMYIAYLLYKTMGLDPIMMLPVAALGLFVVGYLLQRYLVNYFIEVPEHVQFLLLLAVAMVFTNLFLMIFGPDARGVQLPYAFDSYNVGPLVIDKVRLIAAVIAVLIAALLGLFFAKTRTGKAIRACADNLTGAQVVGLDVKHLYAVTFGLGAACVGAGGALMLLLVDVHPHLTTDYTLLGFIIVIIGGLGSLPGALLGGVLIGLSEAFAGFFLAASMKSMFAFGLLILVLLFRPNGLLGRGA